MFVRPLSANPIVNLGGFQFLRERFQIFPSYSELGCEDIFLPAQALSPDAKYFW